MLQASVIATLCKTMLLLQASDCHATVFQAILTPQASSCRALQDYVSIISNTFPLRQTSCHHARPTRALCLPCACSSLIRPTPLYGFPVACRQPHPKLITAQAKCAKKPSDLRTRAASISEDLLEQPSTGLASRSGKAAGAGALDRPT